MKLYAVIWLTNICLIQNKRENSVKNNANKFIFHKQVYYLLVPKHYK